jgi:hypothetical protein
MAVYNSGLGQFAMLSYRDPNLEKTLEVYDRCVDAFLAEELDADGVRKTVIATLADLDRPMSPATQGWIAFERKLAGLTDEDRQRFREGVLVVDAAALRQAGREILQTAMASARQSVVAAKERIETANANLPVPFEVEGLE